MTLLELGFQSISLHSMMTQKERIASLTRFRSNNIKILVATDVASRGLDIPSVQLVVNHNVPSNPKEYVHRVGRTARAGRGGFSVTLITPHDIKLLHAIEGRIGKQLLEFKINGRCIFFFFSLLKTIDFSFLSMVSLVLQKRKWPRSWPKCR